MQQNSIEGRSPRIVQRDWTKAGILLACALGADALAFVSYGEGRILNWVLVVLFLLIGLAFTIPALTMCGTAPCPSCRMVARGLRMGRNQGVLCKGCVQYLEGENGQLRVMADDRVADAHVFAAPLPEQFSWPDGCALCGERTTRMVPTTLEVKAESSIGRELGVAIGSLGFLRADDKVVHTLQVPHCQVHGNAVILRPAGMNSTITGLLVAFRSQRMFRRFCEENQVSSAPLGA
jgi:hypothetical protein